MFDTMLRVSSWQTLILATVTLLNSNVRAAPPASVSARSSQKTYALDYRDIRDYLLPQGFYFRSSSFRRDLPSKTHKLASSFFEPLVPERRIDLNVVAFTEETGNDARLPVSQVFHSSLEPLTSGGKLTTTEKSASVSESITDVPDLKEKPPYIEPAVLPLDPLSMHAAPNEHSSAVFKESTIKAGTNKQHPNISKELVEADLLHRPLEGLPEVISQAEHSLDHLSDDSLDPKRLDELSKVMAAWEVHQRKVNEAIEEGTRVTTTTASPSFPFFGASRRAIGRSWRKITNRLFPESLKKMLTIFPGTIWCGAGDKANNDTERLGSQNETDACCRDHDLSKDYIAAGQMAPEYGNIQNKYTFTMSTCESDERFRECLLRNARNGSDSSEAVGYLYFTIIKPKCFTKIVNNCTETKERCSRSSDDFEWTIRENLDFPDPDPRNRLLDAVLVALSAIRYFFPRGLAESWTQLPLVG